MTPGVTLDIARSVIVYQRGDGAEAEHFAYVDDASACTATSFYREGDSLVLCEAACGRVRYDIEAELDLLVPCTFVIE